MKTKFLGQTINENLSWNKYVNNVVCKTSSGLSALLQISQIRNLVISRIIFHSLIQSQKSYGLCIYRAISEEIFVLIQDTNYARNEEDRISLIHLSPLQNFYSQ